MQVTKIINGEVSYNDVPRPADAEMQNEYNYILAEQMTRKMLDNGLISENEFNKIMVKNQQSFSPFIAKICAK